MIEFGSDFHGCEDDFIKNTSCFKDLVNLRYYASGRHALEAIIKQEKWERIWIPAYFCYEVIDYISSLGLEVKFYDDNPFKIDDDYTVKYLPYKEGDVLLRVNYYGLRHKRSNKELNIPVILFDTPYNRLPVPQNVIRVENWLQANEWINKIF